MTAGATHVTVLTPAGVGAVAVFALTGGGAWPVCRKLFRTTGGRELPAEPQATRFWTGRFGAPPGDEVVLSVAAAGPPQAVEIHCHGGRQVVRWLVEQCRESGAVEAEPLVAERSRLWADALALLPHALTERTAGILLDQANGALDESWTDAARMDEALRYVSVGRHLTQAWRVAVAGPPNAGKSSLVNALAGFPRSVVAATAGTTRDAAGVSLAFDGWPVELIDTAGLRTTDDDLEAAGIAAARRALAAADLTLWVTAVGEQPVDPPGGLAPTVAVVNKCDLGRPCDATALPVSARAGTGLAELMRAVVDRLVPQIPPPGAAVPFSEAVVRELERSRGVRD